MNTNTQAAPVTRRDLEAKLIAKAWTDEDFHARVLADPKAVIEEVLDTPLPGTVQITVHQEGPDSLHFVIPHKPEIDLDELSDEDLEKIAGGVDPAVITLVSLVSMGVTATVYTLFVTRKG